MCIRDSTGGGLRHSGTDPGGGRSRAGGNPRQGSRDGGFRPGILPGVQLLPGGNGADHRPQPHDRTLDPLRWAGGRLEAEALPGGEGNLARQSGESRWNFHFQGEDLEFDGAALSTPGPIRRRRPGLLPWSCLPDSASPWRKLPVCTAISPTGWITIPYRGRPSHRLRVRWG